MIDKSVTNSESWVGRVISNDTAKTMVADGGLFDVSNSAREFGFSVPVAITASAVSMYYDWIEEWSKWLSETDEVPRDEDHAYKEIFTDVDFFQDAVLGEARTSVQKQDHWLECNFDGLEWNSDPLETLVYKCKNERSIPWAVENKPLLFKVLMHPWRAAPFRVQEMVFKLVCSYDSDGNAAVIIMPPEESLKHEATLPRVTEPEGERPFGEHIPAGKTGLCEWSTGVTESPSDTVLVVSFHYWGLETGHENERSRAIRSNRIPPINRKAVIRCAQDESVVDVFNHHFPFWRCLAVMAVVD